MSHVTSSAVELCAAALTPVTRPSVSAAGVRVTASDGPLSSVPPSVPVPPALTVTRHASPLVSPPMSWLVVLASAVVWVCAAPAPQVHSTVYDAAPATSPQDTSSCPSPTTTATLPGGSSLVSSSVTSTVTVAVRPW